MENLTPAPPLGLSEDATTVHVENGSTVSSGGPYLGVKGAVGWFYVLEAEDTDAAFAIASRITADPSGRCGRGAAVPQVLVNGGRVFMRRMLPPLIVLAALLVPAPTTIAGRGQRLRTDRQRAIDARDKRPF
jgi:hypothetical protein